MNQRSRLTIDKGVYGWTLTFLYCLVNIGCTALTAHPSVEKEEVYDQRLLFSSNRVGNWEIYMMNSDGSNPVNLTNHPADDRGPTWSPSRKRIAFVSNRDGNEEIYVMNINGSESKRLTRNPESDMSPSWAPDCASCHGSNNRIRKVRRANTERLLFVSERGHQLDIYMINVDGSGEVNLSRTDLADETDPAWALDGEHIVFVSNRDGNKEIYLMNADGSDVVRLTNSLAEERHPQPSPDRNKIAFLLDRNGHRYLFTMDIDGSHQINLPGILSKNVCSAFSWSPDGMRIIFATEGTRANDLYMMNSDGSGKVSLTSIHRDGCPDKIASWSIGGSKLAYAAKEGGNWEIYVMQITGQIPNPVRLTNNTADDVEPEWEPIRILAR